MMIDFRLQAWKSMKPWRFLSILFLLLDSPTIHSQDIKLDIAKNPSQYVLRSWSTEEGMASESTNEILQSEDGYIWIATYAGLHRFDGKDFTIFNSSNSNIPSPTVLRVKKGIHGEIWIGSQHGLAYLKNDEFIVPSPLEPTRDMSIEQMLITKSGDLWFSTRTNELYRYQNNELKNFTADFNLKESTVLSMIESDEGNLYFGTDDSHILEYNPSTKEVRDLTPMDNVNGINDFYWSEKQLFVATGVGLYTYENSTFKLHKGISNRAVTAIHVDQNDVIWLGTMNGLFRWNSETQKLDSLTEENGMPNNIVRDMLVDGRGNLWVATYRNGIFFLSDGSIVSYSKEEGTETSIISSISELSKNTYLLGNENSSFNILQNDKIKPWTPPIAVPTARLKHLFTDTKGRTWVSTYAGLYVLDGDNSRRFTVSDGFPDNYIRVTFEDSKGNIWVGTKNAGLIRFKTLDDWENITIENGLSSNYIMSLEESTTGQIIIGTIGGLNIIEQDGSIQYVTIDDGLPSSFMFSTLATDKFIWLTSNDGLTGYNQDTVVNFNQENGLGFDIVYDIIKDDFGNIWLPSENSILSINLEQLEAAAYDSTIQLTVKHFDKSYGMKNSHCLGAALSLKDSQGMIWVPTLDGVVSIDPKEINAPVFEPYMIIENVLADQEELDVTNRITVPASTIRLLIDFTAISYVQTDRLEFRYKLEPFDKDWIQASGERNGVYTNLPPGKYQFKLQTGVDGKYNETYLSKEIFIKAAWWQTLWARVLIGVTIILLALLIYWLRLRALTSRNMWLESTVAERTKELEEQKSELNDAIEQLKNVQEQMVQSDKMASLGVLSAGVAHEINNPLNFIQGGVEGLEQTLINGGSPTREEFNILIGAIKEGVHRASKIVSSLNEFSHSADDRDEPCDIQHIIDNCLTMLQYRIKNDIELIKHYRVDDVKIMANNGKIHQVFLNIITNALQAIESTGTIRINTWNDRNYVYIEVIDSGQGIKPEDLPKITEPFFSTKEPGKGTGLGLSITYAIITEHKGKLTYSSEWGKGTTARIVLPRIK